MTNKYRLLIYLSILFFLMCSKDNTLKIDKEEKELEFMFQFGDKSANGSVLTRSEDIEKLVKDLTILTYVSSSQEREVLEFIDFPYTRNSSNIDLSKWEDEGIIILRHATILNNLSRLRDVHLILNVNDDYFLYGIKPEDATTPVITSEITYPFIMYGNKEQHDFSQQNRLPVTVVRNIAKVAMNINTTNHLIDGNDIKLLPVGEQTTAHTIRVANKSYLLPRSTNPPDTEYINYPERILEVKERTENTTFTSFTTYINENLLDVYDVKNESNITSIILQIPYEYNGIVNTENYYKIYIGEKDEITGKTNYKVNRNTIYAITANIKRLGGETPLDAPLIEGNLEIIPWDDNSEYSEITQTELTVKETVTYMAFEKDFYYFSNAPKEELSLNTQHTANWLQVEFDEDDPNNIKLIADKDSYTEPRYTTFILQAKNLNKTITVWQQPVPSTGSISLSKDSLHLFEYRPSAEVELTLTGNEQWEIWEGDLDIATMSPVSGSGNTTLTFGISQNYGNTTFKIVNKETLEYAEIDLITYHLDCPDDLEFGAQGGSYAVNINAYGGIEEWDLLGYEGHFISNLKKENNQLLINIDENTLNAEKYGWVTICHATYRDYIKTIPITQSDFVGINIEDVDHLVFGVNHEAVQRSLFAAWEVVPFGIPELEKTFGSNLTTEDIYYNNNPLYPFLFGPNSWTNSHGHTNWFYLCIETFKKIDALMPNTLPQHIEFNLYACWAQGNALNNGVAVSEPVYLDVIAYSGGTVVRKPAGSSRKQEFQSEGGQQVYNATFNEYTTIYAQNGYHYNNNGLPQNSNRCDRYSCRHKGLNVYAEIYDRLYPETYNKVAKITVDWKKGGVKVQFEDSSQDWRPSCPSESLELYQP